MRRANSVVLSVLAAAIVAAPADPAIAPGDDPPPDPGIAGVPHCTVPRVRGLQLRIAKRRLIGAKCEVGMITRKRSSTKKGGVISSTPAAGTLLALGTRVDLLVSKGR